MTRVWRINLLEPWLNDVSVPVKYFLVCINFHFIAATFFRLVKI